MHRIITFSNNTAAHNEEKTAVVRSFHLLFDEFRVGLIIQPPRFRTLTEGYHKRAGVVCERQSNPSHSQSVPRGREEALLPRKNVCAC